MKFLPIFTIAVTSTTSLIAMMAFQAIAQESRGFQTPSDNIHCVVSEISDNVSQLRCDLTENTAPIPVKPKECNLDWGNAFAMNVEGEAQRVCHGDIVYNPNRPVLQYGKRFRYLGYSCISKTTGLICTNRDGRGWELSRSKQRLF
jgi:hypothetical protein